MAEKFLNQTGLQIYNDALQAKIAENYATKEYVNNITNTGGLTFLVVETLPEEPVEGTVYLVPSTSSISTLIDVGPGPGPEDGETEEGGSSDSTTTTPANIYDEYMWISNQWELIGSTAIDLSQYYTKTEIDSTLTNKADTSAIPTKISQLTNDSGYITNIPYIVGTGTKSGTWLGSHDGITEYYDGLTIAYKLNVAGASTTTLNINGLGAIKVARNATTEIGTAFPVNSILLLTYTTTSSTGYWVIADQNSTYTNTSLGFGYGVCDTAETTLAKALSITSYSLVAGSFVSVKFTYAVPANSTLNIRTRGAKAIYYNGAAITDGVINAGDVVTFLYDGSHYVLISKSDFATKSYVDSLFNSITNGDEVSY